jgi:hypothetical protein
LGSTPSADELNDQIDLSGLIPDNLADLAAQEIRSGSTARAPQSGPATPASMAPETAETADEPARADIPPTILQQMGGPMGMVDSGLPVVVFIVANIIGGLGWGIGAAVATAVVIAILRIARKRPVTQAIGGLFGVGIAAFIAYKTGSAKGYFLWGIWLYLAYASGLLLSIFIRWPLVGVVWEGINGKGTAWRKDKKLVRRYDWATSVWVAVFALRYLVQNYLYDTDQVGWLAAVRLLMGYPVFIVAIVVSAWIVVGGHPVRLVRDALAARRNATASGAAPARQPDPPQPGER